MSKETKADSKSVLKQRLEMYELIFDSIHNGAIVTDADGNITHFNQPYGVFLDLNPADQIGRHCTEAVENSRLHIVAKTGKQEILQTQRIKGQDMVVQRIPIRKDGEVIAVFGQVMFKDVRDVGKLARKLSLLESKVKYYEEELINLRSTRYSMESIIGKSQVIRQLKKEALHASGNHLPVLIAGESGTGKELFAQAIHHASQRKIHPFVRINCAAIPKDLLESELFGYEKGAFTGARQRGKPGKFELAHRGTIFLDEIGDLPLEMQPKLLRVLEEREFERIGGTTPIRTDFRVIAATNQNLEEMMTHGRFRSDLYYRLNVINLTIPPLRKRKRDIIALARHMLEKMAPELAAHAINLSTESEILLMNHHWPGNVRELSNVLERTLSTLEGDQIHPANLPFYLHREGERRMPASGNGIREIQSRSERDAITAALQRTGNNKSQAARLLGIHRTLLYKKMKKHRIPLG